MATHTTSKNTKEIRSSRRTESMSSWIPGSNPPNSTLLVILRRWQRRSALVEQLTAWGWNCLVALSAAEALEVLKHISVPVVLSPSGLPGHGCAKLMEALESSPSWLFVSVPLEDSCLWVPAIVAGKRRWGPEALSPAQLAQVLKDLLREPRSSGLAGNKVLTAEQ